MKLIRTDRIKHQYDVWKGDEKFKRTALDGVDLAEKSRFFLCVFALADASDRQIFSVSSHCTSMFPQITSLRFVKKVPRQS